VFGQHSARDQISNVAIVNCCTISVLPTTSLQRGSLAPPTGNYHQALREPTMLSIGVIEVRCDHSRFGPPGLSEELAPFWLGL